MSEIVRHGDRFADPGFRKLLADTVCKGASPAEFDLFAAICSRTGLDPIARQIYMIPRWDRKLGREVMQPLVSIDGARLTAQRSGEYQGQTHPVWCGEDGVWREVWLSSKPPVAARIGAYRSGFREPCYAVALFDEYVPRGKDGSPTGQWGKMPALMLAKCAEMLALRKAFPAELSGLYSAEEMAQAESEAPARKARVEVVEAVPEPENPKAKPGSREDVVALLGEAKPEPVEREIEVDPDIAFQRFDGKSGPVWRGTSASLAKPLAIKSPSDQSMIEANAAFGHRSRVRVRDDGRNMIVLEVLREEVRR